MICGCGGAIKPRDHLHRHIFFELWLSISHVTTRVLWQRRERSSCFGDRASLRGAILVQSQDSISKIQGRLDNFRSDGTITTLHHHLLQVPVPVNSQFTRPNGT
jgi:hypothetical protein